MSLLTASNELHQQSLGTAIPAEIRDNLNSVREKVFERGYAVLRLETFREIIAAAREEYLGSIARLPLHPQATRFRPEDLGTAPWRKVAIGGTNGLGEGYAQFLVTTYVQEGSVQHPGLSKLFRMLIELRNALTSMRVDFGSIASRDLFWNACRIHHYPRGGGFMSAHRDTHFPSALAGQGLPFLQIMACMSKRGEDFFTGGGFVRDRSDTYVSTDTEDSFGAIVLFDGSIVHGVDTVDPDTIPDFDARSGRIAAFVNLYKVL